MNSKSHLFLLLLLLLIVPLLFIPSQSQPPPVSDSFISLLISTAGLDFAKDLLVTTAVSSLTPLHLPPIEKSQRIPLVGNVNVLLSNITLYRINVSDSYITPGDSVIAIVVSGATANLSIDWRYSYSTGWLFPVEISDKGKASVQVEGLQVGLTLGFEDVEGSLKLTLLQCGCFVEDITIKLDGGASWFYQGFVNAFKDQIQAAVENAVTSKLNEGVKKLDSLLQTLPKSIPVDNITSLNVTFTQAPVLTNSSIGFEIDGLFTNQKQLLNFLPRKDFSSFSSDDPSKMLAISIDEAVFLSASDLYFNAGYMKWIVDTIPDQSLLNTAGWRFVIPQLYKRYPNDDMNLNVSLSAPPLLKILPQKIDATVSMDVIIDVLEAGEVIPVACISLEIEGSGLVKIAGNNLAGSIKLNNFVMSLKWSRIGTLRMRLIQPVIWTLIQTAFLPYANSRLSKGFPLPIVHGFTLQNADISFLDSQLLVCSDVDYTGSYKLGGGSLVDNFAVNQAYRLALGNGSWGVEQ